MGSESEYRRQVERAVGGLKMFTPEDIKILARNNFVPYTLTGKDFQTLRKEVIVMSHAVALSDVKDSSRISEVAINPNRFFVTGSKGKNIFENEHIAHSFNKDFIDRSEARVYSTVGGLADYIELALLHKKRTGKDLFLGDTFVATEKMSEREIGQLVVRQINFGFQIEFSSLLDPANEAAVAPLIVPVSRR